MSESMRSVCPVSIGGSTSGHASSALDPVVAEALKKPDREKAILDLKVCDPDHERAAGVAFK
ncbi:MAG: hypothetical protein IIB38_09655 [Candidatus Hydrogenedentes bacterium]|nr:hypothetical protein [Candidatus Hydrogenedentota bacterium]